MLKTIIISIIIGIIIGGSTIFFINKGVIDEFEGSIIHLTETNGELIKLNSEAKEYNKKLKSSIKEFEDILTGDYREFEQQLGVAGTNIEELGDIIGAATLQISRIIEERVMSQRL